MHPVLKNKTRRALPHSRVPRGGQGAGTDRLYHKGQARVQCHQHSLTATSPGRAQARPWAGSGHLLTPWLLWDVPTPPQRYSHPGEQAAGTPQGTSMQPGPGENLLYAWRLSVSGARCCRPLQGSTHLHSPGAAITGGASQRRVHPDAGQVCTCSHLPPHPGTGNSSITYHFLVLGQDKVVIAEGHTENNCCHAFKAVDPLLPLRPLATNIKHPGRGRRTISAATEISLPGHRIPPQDGGDSARDFQTSRVQGKPRTRPNISKADSSEPSLPPGSAHWISKFFSLEQFQQEELDVTQKPADSPGHA